MFLRFFSSFLDFLMVFALSLTIFLLTLQPKRKILVSLLRWSGDKSQKKRFNYNDEKNKNARAP